jgi:NAD(P)-dependent dehydrogenase (short-subunit alcohol dehydrogenase family)
MESLVGRSAIITGASQGLGLAIAEAYVRAGANVLLCARDAERLAAAHRQVAALAPTEDNVVSMPADVASAVDAELLVETALSRFGALTILVNNAGVYGPKGSLETLDWAEWVRAIEANLYGSVLMCRAVLPHFKTRGYGKIVQLSGGGATNPLPNISAYAASKAAIVRVAETLAEEVRADHIDVNSIAPGALNTRLLDEVLIAGPEKVGAAFYDRAVRQKEQGGAPLDKGAELAVFLGAAASDGITGKLISAVWDPWETLADRLDALRQTDVYTLRRIVPKDRGFDWGER